MPAIEPKQPKLPKKKAGCEGRERKNLLEIDLRDFLCYSSLFSYPANGIAWWVFGVNPDEFDAVIYEN